MSVAEWGAGMYNRNVSIGNCETPIIGAWIVQNIGRHPNLGDGAAAGRKDVGFGGNGSLRRAENAVCGYGAMGGEAW